MEATYEESTDTLTITGTGTLKKDDLAAKLKDLNTERKDQKASRADHVIINEGITKLGDRSLDSYETILYMKTLKLPNSLEEIGKYAFLGAT